MSTETISPHRRTDLIVFTRFPKAGTTKTRLIPHLGRQGAAELQRRMTEKIVATCTSFSRMLQVQPVICFCGGSKNQMESWLGTHQYREQQGGDLGEKMRTAFEESFKSGANQAILIGTDIPAIDIPLLTQAVEYVQSQKIVIGPTYDGGYYLIGLHKSNAKRLYPTIFKDIRWSTRAVFATTIANLQKYGANPYILPKLHDVDLPEDLSHARKLGLL